MDFTFCHSLFIFRLNELVSCMLILNVVTHLSAFVYIEYVESSTSPNQFACRVHLSNDRSKLNTFVYVFFYVQYNVLTFM